MQRSLQREDYRKEIADELNVSRETASWLVERSDAAPTDQPSQTQTDRPAGGPQDIHVDWSAIGRDSGRMGHVAAAMADLLAKHGKNVDLTIGIEKAGGPIATLVARELETDLGTYTPRNTSGRKATSKTSADVLPKLRDDSRPRVLRRRRHDHERDDHARDDRGDPR